jgi:hypothetical protein
MREVILSDHLNNDRSFLVGAAIVSIICSRGSLYVSAKLANQK